MLRVIFRLLISWVYMRGLDFTRWVQFTTQYRTASVCIRVLEKGFYIMGRSFPGCVRVEGLVHKGFFKLVVFAGSGVVV